MALFSCACPGGVPKKTELLRPSPTDKLSDQGPSSTEDSESLSSPTRKKILMPWWVLVTDQQGKLLIVPNPLTKEDTQEMHFRQQRWRSLQLAPAQVTSSESVYWATPAYSYQCQPLSKCVGCWSHCQPASIHSNVCPWERPAIFSWPKGLNQTKVHACMRTHAHKCVHKIKRFNRTAPVWVGSDQLSAFMSVN